jgi:hypothetical protein
MRLVPSIVCYDGYPRLNIFIRRRMRDSAELGRVFGLNLPEVVLVSVSPCSLKRSSTVIHRDTGKTLSVSYSKYYCLEELKALKQN